MTTNSQSHLLFQTRISHVIGNSTWPSLTKSRFSNMSQLKNFQEKKGNHKTSNQIRQELLMRLEIPQHNDCKSPSRLTDLGQLKSPFKYNLKCSYYASLCARKTKTNEIKLDTFLKCQSKHSLSLNIHKTDYCC